MIHRQELLNQADRLCPLNSAAARAAWKVAECSQDWAVLERAVECDPASTANLLREANSARYGRSGQVDTVRAALDIVGQAQLREVVLADGWYDCASARASADHRGFMAHSVATAVLARRLSAEVQADSGACFLGGLLHDIGKLAIETYYPEEERQIMGALRSGSRALIDVERDALGADHGVIGGWLAEHWHYPGAIAAAIGFHHQADACPTPFQRVCDVVYLADTLAHAFGYGSDVVETGRCKAKSVSDRLRVNPRGLEVLASDAVAEISRSLRSGAMEASG